MQYLCFVTGIVLAMVGATFILGKLREPQTDMEVKGGAVPFMIKTSTPGLVLVALGTLMMLSPIFSHQNILIQDASTYLKLWYLDGVSHDDRIRDFSDSTLPDSSGTVDSNEVEAAILREQMRKQQK